jgi:sugar lactone lactonase YvrE
MSGLVLDIARELLSRNRDRRAIPVLDGPMRPNSRLDQCPVVSTAVTAPDDIAITADGVAYVTSGNSVVRFADVSCEKQEILAQFDGFATALSTHPAGGVVVAVAGQGLAFLDGPDSGRMLEIPQSTGLLCPTALWVSPAGDIYICDGSRFNPPDRWAHDLMQKRRSGRVLRVDARTREVEILARDLAYPNGICLSKNGESLLVCEAWTHNVLKIPMEPKSGSRQELVIQNLPGYPARIMATSTGYCLSLFALRTQLVDFVLTEDRYRHKMMERIEPAFWISPALKSEGHYLEPVQGAGLRKHGSLKAWAPPRSYGLVILLDTDLQVQESLHSRVGGSCHGITGLAEYKGELFFVSKGDNKIVRAMGDVQ